MKVKPTPDGVQSHARLHLPSEEEPLGRFILRDGSVALLRRSVPADLEGMRRFFRELSPADRYQRFASVAEPDAETIARLCDSAGPDAGVTLVAIREADGTERIIGTGSYFRIDAVTAEVAFAVAESFQGRGIATGILERLAIEAGRRGIRRFVASTRPDNLAMVTVFTRCGFRTALNPDREAIDVELDLLPTSKAVQVAEAHEHEAAARSIEPFIAPSSVVVVGVSSGRGRIGRRIYDAIGRSGFPGPRFAVNGRGGPSDGIATFRSVRDLPAPVDLAVVAVPAGSVAGVIDDCAAAGVRAVVVISAGFAEAGVEGARLQQALVEQVRAHGMRLIGPNCMGVLSADPRRPLNATFSPHFPPAGHLALASQSGALGIVVVALSMDRRVGISSFVSLGNKADVSGNDLLQYWEADPATRVIGLYLESFGNPRRFARLARRIGRQKPIIAVKSGRSRSGSQAAGSHTAALAASDIAVDALFRQTGVIRAGTIDELIDIAACLEAQALPAGRRVAIVTNGGGPGILAADACEAAGLTMASLSSATTAALQSILPPAASIGNPIDMFASAGPDEYRESVRAALADENVDALLVLFTSVDMTTSQAMTLAGIADGVRAARRQGHTTPVLACVMGDELPPPIDVGVEHVPTYAFPENAARALAQAAAYAEWKRAPAGVVWTFSDCRMDDIRVLIDRAVAAGGDWLSTEDTRTLFSWLGTPIVPLTFAHTADDAVMQAVAMGLPVVAKLHAPGLVHKTEAGGVMPDLETPEAVRSAFDALRTRAVAANLSFGGVALQPMIAGGIEAMVGVSRDPAMGALVGVGMGGTQVEVIGDVQFGLCPLTDRDAEQLLASTRLARLLSGFRGRPPADSAALSELVLRLSALATEVSGIAEIDLNPVMVLPRGQGCRIVDARVRVRPAGHAADMPASGH